jgi:hypothetical protein
MTVALVERFGSGVLVSFAANGLQVTAIAATGTWMLVEEGQTVMVRLQADYAHVFDRATGLALGRGCPTG